MKERTRERPGELNRALSFFIPRNQMCKGGGKDGDGRGEQLNFRSGEESNLSQDLTW